MAQKLLGASGVAAVLIIAGIILNTMKISEELGKIAIFAGITLLVIFGILGIIGILRKIK